MGSAALAQVFRKSGKTCRTVMGEPRVEKRRDAKNVVGQAVVERHRGMLYDGPAESPMRPGLRRTSRSERKQSRHFVVIKAARRSDVDDEAVDPLALQAAVIERRCDGAICDGGDTVVECRGIFPIHAATGDRCCRKKWPVIC
jgi:hypothetical protein